MNKGYTVLLILAIGLLLFFGLKKGLENETDPLWVDMNTLANTPTMMLSSQETALQATFDSIHPNIKTNAFEFIRQPFMLTITWDKFNGLLHKILDEKKIIISGSSGTGKSTLLDRISLIITGDKSRITKIDCIEGLEEDYHKRWIGYYDNRGFNKGKLLELFETCTRDTTHKYVLIIDDFDKMYRTTFFGEAIWKELGQAKQAHYILGYDTEISIPENLYIISTASMGINKVPLTPSDYRRLSNGNVYQLSPSVYQLKDYLLQQKTIDKLSETTKDTLARKLYLFEKTNEVIKEKVGENATIGQWSRIRKLLKKNDFASIDKFVLSNVKNYKGAENFGSKDINYIQYALAHNGRLKGTNPINRFFDKSVDFGIFSELTVAILFAFFSFIGIRWNNRKRKQNLQELRKAIDKTEKSYFADKISYKDTYGQLLLLEDDIHEKTKQGKLDFSQANYLIHEIENSLETMDFISELGDENKDLIGFVKKIIADDDITIEEYNSHLEFLYQHKHTMDKSTYKAIKQRLIRLHHKSNLKFGRTIIE